MKDFDALRFPDFKDFKLIVRSREDGHFEGQVVDSPAGHASDSLAFHPGAEKVEEWLGALQQALAKALHDRDSASRKRLGELQQELGEHLGRLLLNGAIGQLFASSEAQADLLARKQRADGLRFHLCFDPKDQSTLPLAALPWELMLHPLQGRHFLQDADRWFVRYFETGEVIPELEIEGTLKVLLVASEPKIEGAVSLALEEEMERISAALERLDCEVETYRQPDLDRMCRMLHRGGHHILHFMGHGYFDRDEGEGLLGFVEGESELAPVTGPMLGRRLAKLRNLQLVVLNACSTASLPRVVGQRPFASMASALLAAGVPAVVAMQMPISDSAAVAFSQTFYRALAERVWVEEAVSRGRMALMDRKSTEVEWATPVLFLRGRRGNLFGLPLDRLPEVQYVGVRSFVEGFRADMPKTCKPVLELGEYFDPESGWRKIVDSSLWNHSILPKLEMFVKEIDERRPIRLELAAHNSIAFALGRELATKGGLDLEVVQRGRRGEEYWRATEGDVPGEPMWNVGEPIVIDPEATEVAFAIAITIDVLTDVETFIRQGQLPIHHIVPIEIDPKAGQTAISSGAHAVALADELVKLTRRLPVEQRDACLHLFAAAPHSFMFFLGQESYHLGSIQLYEHGHGGKTGAYAPSIRIGAFS